MIKYVLTSILLCLSALAAKFKAGDCVIGTHPDILGHRAKILSVEETFYRIKPTTIQLSLPYVEVEIAGLEKIAKKTMCTSQDNAL